MSVRRWFRRNICHICRPAQAPRPKTTCMRDVVSHDVAAVNQPHIRAVRPCWPTCAGSSPSLPAGRAPAKATVQPVLTAQGPHRRSEKLRQKKLVITRGVLSICLMYTQHTSTAPWTKQLVVMKSLIKLQLHRAGIPAGLWRLVNDVLLLRPANKLDGNTWTQFAWPKLPPKHPLPVVARQVQYQRNFRYTVPD